MHRIAYIAPPLTALWLVLCLGITPDWWAYLVMLAVAELVLWLGLRRMSRKREYLSGYAHAVEHHNPWIERVVTTETYTDSRGRTHTRQRVHYVRHSDEWWMWLNTGKSIAIDSTTYNVWPTYWATPCEQINPYHPNCVSGGGGQRYAWNGVYEDAATVTYKGLYINYLANSNSIFLEERIRKPEPRRWDWSNTSTSEARGWIPGRCSARHTCPKRSNFLKSGSARCNSSMPSMGRSGRYTSLWPCLLLGMGSRRLVPSVTIGKGE